MKFLSALTLVLLLLTGCNNIGLPSAPAQTQTPSPGGEATELPPTPTTQPTPTVAPAAIRVNGEGIPQAEYEAAVQQLKEASPELDEPQVREKVLANLVDEALLAQGAQREGFTVDEAALQQRWDDLAQKSGGADKLNAWIARNGYTSDSFRSALRRAAAAAWQRDHLAAQVPEEMEQVRARQILLNTEQAANEALARAKSPGTNFARLALGYDLAAGGDLYWFPRGYLTEPAVEEAAFALQVGEISGVIPSSIGFHILQVTGREVRKLSADARQTLQTNAILAWLAEQRAAAAVEILLP